MEPVDRWMNVRTAAQVGLTEALELLLVAVDPKDTERLKADIERYERVVREAETAMEALGWERRRGEPVVRAQKDKAVVLIGRRFYRESGSALGMLMERSTGARYDWARVEREVETGDSLTIVPPTPADLGLAEALLTRAKEVSG